MVLSGQALRGNCARLPAGNVQLKIRGVINAGDDFGNENSIIIENAQGQKDLNHFSFISQNAANIKSQ